MDSKKQLSDALRMEKGKAQMEILLHKVQRQSAVRNPKARAENELSTSKRMPVAKDQLEMTRMKDKLAFEQSQHRGKPKAELVARGKSIWSTLARHRLIKSVFGLSS